MVHAGFEDCALRFQLQGCLHVLQLVFGYKTAASQ
jgi:hypothetical protein